MTQKEKKQQMKKRKECISHLQIISVWLDFAIKRHENLTANEMQQAMEWIENAIEVLGVKEDDPSQD